MPLFSASQIVGGGAQLLAPLTVGNIPQIVDVGPPGALSNTDMRQWADAGVNVITVGAVNANAGVGATETMRLTGGLITLGAGADSTRIGRGAAAAGVDGIAIGRTATASQSEVIAIGRGASATGTPAIAIGPGATAPANSTISIGNATNHTNASNAMAIGHGANTTANGGSPQLMAIGNNSSIGWGVGGIVSMAIGHSTVARAYDLVIGQGSQSSGASGSDSSCIIIGHSSNITQATNRSILIGHFSSVSAFTATRNIGIGNSLTFSGVAANNIVLGESVAMTVGNHCVLGGGNIVVNTVLIGGGFTAASLPAKLIRFTNGTSTSNLVAGAVTLQAPLGTGNAASAPINFDVGVPGASGATTQTAATMVRVSYTNIIGQTGLVIWDVDTASLQRVLVGAAGTGPGGVGRALYLA